MKSNYERLAGLLEESAKALRDADMALSMVRGNSELEDFSTLRKELSIRAIHCLESAEIKSLLELSRHSADELVCIRNFGAYTLRECQEALERHGLKLKDNNESDTDAFCRKIYRKLT